MLNTRKVRLCVTKAFFFAHHDPSGSCTTDWTNSERQALAMTCPSPVGNKCGFDFPLVFFFAFSTLDSSQSGRKAQNGN